MGAASEMGGIFCAALELVSAGFAAFPLHPRTKTPITEHGFKDATSDANQVRAWWASTPDANIDVKTNLLNLQNGMLDPEDDDYACTCNPETFAMKKLDDASRSFSDVARLAGMHFVETSELPKNMLFNVARPKQPTGRDKIAARFLHENEIQFHPQFTLVMAANNAPRVNETTLFESDCIHAIPLNNHLEADQRNLGPRDRLTEAASLSGILNWRQDSGYQAERKSMVDSCAVAGVTKRNVVPDCRAVGGAYV